LERIHSTNDYAKSLLKQHVKTADGTVIIADLQEQGRGQYGNSWNSAAGKNLTFSIIYYPKFLKASEQFLLSQTICVGLVGCIKAKISHHVFIKWPNDIVIERKKVCGILIENTITHETLNESIIGIGMNVNQTEFSENIQHATSLKLITEHDFNLDDLLIELLICIEKYYLKLMRGETDFIREQYLENLFQSKITADYKINNNIEKGIIEGVNKLGQLELSVNGKLKLFNNKEFEFIL
jgi:BirA family biotin operon repressor/biotin-[acetyl-CoA-carboxylase] ligase